MGEGREGEEASRLGPRLPVHLHRQRVEDVDTKLDRNTLRSCDPKVKSHDYNIIIPSSLEPDGLRFVFHFVPGPVGGRGRSHDCHMTVT